MKKQDSISLRKKVRNLYAKGMKKTAIAEMLGISRKFVANWCHCDEKRIEKDNRGWKPGRKRKYSDAEEKAVEEKRKELEERFFLERKRSVKHSETASQKIS